MSSLALDRGSTQAPAIDLVANGKILSTVPNRLGALEPTDPSIGVEAIRRLYHEHGYVWLKRFLDPAAVNAFRGWVFAHLARGGLIAPGSDPMMGLSANAVPDKSQVDRILMSLVRSVAFEGFCAQRRLGQFMDEFLSGISYLHKRKIMRFTQPGTTTATPAHYDLVYLRGGTSRLVTAWIPIGDTPVDMGGLVYLEGSHAIGARMEEAFARKSQDLSAEERISAFNRNMTEGGWVSKDLPEMAERFDTRWLIADYEAGDVVLHSPYMIHASTTNQSASNRIRLSTDIRYQNVDDEIDARWSNHWSLGDML
ncbi:MULTISPECIES: phytanoyl-CoA dioxygenase family protein [unclassified Rhizobium]|uniref:phytanoyl-CoA dioxygenase family protein n=1 Tax=unclassified Rhizobium TaxID=2613769 RepID=UPI00161CA35B|nr:MULTISPECIES: phytanoyl-CoA dioxygenase family protein [unclassified Rhizobium]MBB3541770.1 ectoine hydroxylase-related dioxygenase (phytanoyl-CoA dioxygenase family) [Rhizobium sp. BK399]MCS3740650.1 ectoine hydroxylase-related dioxygenase (phytanoyl-CoA dioxygenase family) [Rhizobium sp. BK661]MCS4092514.1 ectoine hydroxylase-related dioxygenase (phytanoyl-CoA dioxygenase family) [Rhizobium sp. BK176]